MMERAFLLILAFSLAGCGGSPPRDSAVKPMMRSAPVAHGPISKACLQSNRETRSARLCTCIQAAADQTLGRSDQRRAVAFYSNPHLAQQIRQSDRAVDEKFWKAYKAYGARAEKLCG